MRTKIIILAGPPGSGKGTQAELLEEKFHFLTLSVSQIIRERFQNNPAAPEVVKAKEDYRDGHLIDGRLVAQWIAAKIKTLDKKRINQGLIIDGAARTIEEAKEVYPLLSKIVGKEGIRLFFIKIRPEETFRRNLSRIICSRCHRPIDPSLIGKVKVCPYCGGKLVRRKMDNPEVIKTRIKVYREQTLPAINYFKKQGIVIEINGEQPIKKVFQDISAHLI